MRPGDGDPFRLEPRTPTTNDRIWGVMILGIALVLLVAFMLG